MIMIMTLMMKVILSGDGLGRFVRSLEAWCMEAFFALESAMKMFMFLASSILPVHFVCSVPLALLPAVRCSHHTVSVLPMVSRRISLSPC